MSAGERLPGTPTPMHTWTGRRSTIAGTLGVTPMGRLSSFSTAVVRPVTRGEGQGRPWGTLAITQWLLMLEVMVIPVGIG